MSLLPRLSSREHNSLLRFKIFIYYSPSFLFCHFRNSLSILINLTKFVYGCLRTGRSSRSKLYYSTIRYFSHSFIFAVSSRCSSTYGTITAFRFSNNLWFKFHLCRLFLRHTTGYHTPNSSNFSSKSID